jgi:hypothetical protein
VEGGFILYFLNCLLLLYGIKRRDTVEYNSKNNYVKPLERGERESRGSKELRKKIEKFFRFHHFSS